MATKVEPVPIAASPLTPYICCKDAKGAIDFYKKAFNAEEVMRMEDPKSGKIGHAEIRIGMAQLFLSDEYPEMKTLSPVTLGGTPVMLHLYVKDVDAFTQRAVTAGLTVERPVENMFYGDRAGSFKDPYGHKWWISSHVEDVSPDELKKRAEKMHKEHQP
jgi:PhnB protein